jgi:hypothetical protein
MVVGNAVDVIEDESHPPTVPTLPLSAHPAHPLFEPSGVQPSLELAARIRGALDHHLLKGSARVALANPRAALESKWSVEILHAVTHR